MWHGLDRFRRPALAPRNAHPLPQGPVDPPQVVANGIQLVVDLGDAGFRPVELLRIVLEDGGTQTLQRLLAIPRQARRPTAEVEAVAPGVEARAGDLDGEPDPGAQHPK